MTAHLFRLANKLFDYCFPAYLPLYAGWKTLSDRHERALLRDHIRPGMTIVDVGANIGIYTAFFTGLVGSQGHVHAFEPAPGNFRRLKQREWMLRSATLNQAAVGSESGILQLYLSEELNVDHRTFDSGDGRHSIDVPVESLDDYFAAGERVDLIKIDVQGFELSVLKGAERVLAENVDIKILMEFWPYGLKKALVEPVEVLDFLTSLGFEVHPIRPTGRSLTDCAATEAENIAHYSNIFAMRPPRGGA